MVFQIPVATQWSQILEGILIETGEIVQEIVQDVEGTPTQRNNHRLANFPSRLAIQEPTTIADHLGLSEELKS